ncbi:MAG: alpha/beta fold hydrolase [Bdellovibrio sp.]|nr:MAG: alpha/beta fold hydrolase [Bdellovibrio sp.]
MKEGVLKKNSKKVDILALHGFWGRGSQWKNLLSSFSFWAPDLFTFDSPWGPQRFQNMKDWAKSWNQWVRQEVGVGVELWGYSLGGRLALHAFLLEPELYRSLVLLSAHPGGELDVQARKSWDEKWSQDFLQISWEELFQKWNGQNLFKHDSLPPRFFEGMSREALSQAFLKWSPRNHSFSLEDLKTFRNRIFWVCGGKDFKYKSLYQRLRAQGRVQNLCEVPTCGHRLIQAQPQDFWAAFEVCRLEHCSVK